MHHITGSPAHQLRLLISDVDENRQVLTDDHVEGYLSLYGVTPTAANASPSTVPMHTVRRAAADALDAIATSETLVSKVIRTQDLSTDGPKVADALRRQATALRAQADVDEDAAAVDDGEGMFDVVEFSPYPRGRW